MYKYAVFMICAIVIAADSVVASPLPTHGEIIPLNGAVLTQPEYMEELANKLEKEGEAALKKQEEEKNLGNEFDSNNDGGANNKKYSSTSDQRILNPTGSTAHFNRNFDEIDRAGFAKFERKRNIDPIDAFGIPSFKRNFDEIDRSSGFSGFSKRNLDQIDAGGFSGFKGSYYDKPNSVFKRNFDEIDSSGFSEFSKRDLDEIDRGGFNGFEKRMINNYDLPVYGRKRNIDEIDRAGFNEFMSKRNFDEIDRAGFNGFAKRYPVWRSLGPLRSIKLHQGKR